MTDFNLSSNLSLNISSIYHLDVYLCFINLRQGFSRAVHCFRGVKKALEKVMCIVVVHSFSLPRKPPQYSWQQISSQSVMETPQVLASQSPPTGCYFQNKSIDQILPFKQLWSNVRVCHMPLSPWGSALQAVSPGSEPCYR